MRMQSNERPGFNLARLITFTVTMFLFAMLVSSAGLMQAKKPISKKGLLDTLRTNVVPTDRLVQEVERRGVNFQVTPSDEADLRAAGARPELIEAAKANFRSETPATNTPAPTRPSGAARSSTVPAGPPLSKNEVVTLLQSGVPVTRVEEFVEVRGVTFSITPDVAREIKAAGGNNALIGAITSKSVISPANNSSNNTTTASNAGPDYDELTDQAVAAMQASNGSYAIQLLQQAVKQDSTQPKAFALLGFAQLYGNQDILSAEKSMRAAIERGGGAVFRTYHDHDGFFTKYCQGSFFVTKSGVSFKADDGNHTFEAKDSAIKEAKLNGFVGSEHGAFHVKVIEANGKSKNYNFAPATTKKVESNLLLNLISSYQ